MKGEVMAEPEPIELLGEKGKLVLELKHLGCDIYEMDGVKFSGAFFRTFLQPDPNRHYTFERSGELITVTEVRFDGRPLSAGA